jgi:selenocysteine lyase/cysteine desulfurase
MRIRLMGIASFDAAAVKRQFPGLVDPKLHYLDSAATVQMPDAVLHVLRVLR